MDEPYGSVIHASDDGMNKANQDDCRPDMTNSGNVVASSSGDDGDDPFRENPKEGECGGDESPPGGSDTEEDQDEDIENAFEEEAVEVDGRDNLDGFPHFAFLGDMDNLKDVVDAGVANDYDEEEEEEEEEEKDMVALLEE